jgi:HK97 family phage prohead protease
MKLKFAQLNTTVKSIDDEKKVIRFVFSTADVDRHGEVVDQKGWMLDTYMKNPVVLFGHDHSQPAVGKTIALGYSEDGNLEGDIEFAVDANPKAKVLYELYKGGYMRAVSSGFMNHESDVVGGTVVLKKNELIEQSLVNVPANALALAKSKGIDVSAYETTEDVNKELDEEIEEKEGRVLSKKNRATVEKARVALDELLSADESKSADDLDAETPIKATPAGRAANKNRVLNKAIRSLLAAKQI